MKKLIPLMLLLPAVSFAQVNIDVAVQLPHIHFDVAPALVVVEPGVQVVPNYGEDLYVVDGFYWVRRDDRWYRAKDWHGGWVPVEEPLVPAKITSIPPGHYKHWKSKKALVVMPAGAKQMERSDHGDHGYEKGGPKGKGGKGKKGKH